MILVELDYWHKAGKKMENFKRVARPASFEKAVSLQWSRGMQTTYKIGNASDKLLFLVELNIKTCFKTTRKKTTTKNLGRDKQIYNIN